jgi:hypothetical protein
VEPLVPAPPFAALALAPPALLAALVFDDPLLCVFVVTAALDVLELDVVCCVVLALLAGDLGGGLFAGALGAALFCVPLPAAAGLASFLGSGGFGGGLFCVAVCETLFWLFEPPPLVLPYALLEPVVLAVTGWLAPGVPADIACGSDTGPKTIATAATAATIRCAQCRARLRSAVVSPRSAPVSIADDR